MYSTELKLEIVERYLKGDIGIKKLADEYHVSSGNIRKWTTYITEFSLFGTKRYLSPILDMYNE